MRSAPWAALLLERIAGRYDEAAPETTPDAASL